jgi:hypothetical protein
MLIYQDVDVLVLPWSNVLAHVVHAFSAHAFSTRLRLFVKRDGLATLWQFWMGIKVSVWIISHNR